MTNRKSFAAYLRNFQTDGSRFETFDDKFVTEGSVKPGLEPWFVTSLGSPGTGEGAVCHE